MSYKPYNKSLSGDYKFVWGDEFDGDVLSPEKWTLNAKMGGNERVKLSSDSDTIYVKDGKLHLVAHKIEDGTYKVPVSVVTQDTMNFQYGYVEIKAKVPYMNGVWPSYWTQSTAERRLTPLLEAKVKGVMAEVDIFEIFANNRVAANYIKWVLDKDPENPNKPRTWYYANAFRTQAWTFSDEAFKTINDEYHVYGYEWTEDDKIRMYCDGELYGEYDVSVPYTKMDKEFDDGTLIANGVNNKFADKSGTDMECFDAHQYLIFNNHLFYPSISDAGMYITENTDFTRADYLIDYCRVYQKPGASDIVTK